MWQASFDFYHLMIGDKFGVSAVEYRTSHLVLSVFVSKGLDDYMQNLSRFGFCNNKLQFFDRVSCAKTYAGFYN